ncbi:M57 family metalloprotease [Flavisolibacter tropicus]|uniref:Protease n=1 Tax=Flavisolibacter tropicus TaxID=1492898 RepID=A0A172U0H7_9BACT|nr:M57 family metalloprotease [Flavisolibacter tropicus]ANE52861.1 hypothetical protein SY85_22650 [Flavisolibacter tropicus]
MKHTLNILAVAGTAILLITSCKKDVHDSPEASVSEATLNQIQAAGFSTDNIQKMDGGYLVEGDIFLSDAELASEPTSPNMIIAEEEQYRTFNLVNPNTYSTIKVALNNSSSQHEAVFSSALDEAIRRYNALGLTIKFSRVTSSPNTTVVAFYEVSNVLGSSGFPTSSGAPYNQVRMNTYHYSTSTSSTNINYIATIIAHELGHCIGFRHTDYMRRAYSCGSGGNEGQAKNGVGAVLIPGTPSGPDAASWMLACIGSNVNRPFNSNDVKALNYVY